MNQNREIANSVLELVGGKSNMTEILHCMTRLRIKTKDKSLIDLEKLKAVKGVFGAQFAENALQIVIGPTVDEVYQILIDITGLEAKEMIDEDLDEKPLSRKITPKSIFDSIINTFSSCMTPLIPLFVTMGMVNVVAMVIGPTMLSLVSVESPIYTNFYYIGQAIIYFLPVFVAITAAKQFNCSTMIAVALAGLMLFPDMLAALGAAGGYSIYGIPAPNVTYSGQIIPILLVVFAQSYVEKLFKKIMPNAIRVIGVPLCTLLIMLPITFCALGPVGYYIGSALSSAVLWLYAVAGPVETALVCSVTIFLTAFGIGRPIFFACLGVLMTNGVEFAFMGIANVLQNWIVCGVAAAYAIRAHSPERKQVGITGLIACLLGGVSEPVLFGIILPNRKTYLPTMLAGALSGLFLGLMKVGYYQFGPTNFLNVIGFMGGDGNNFLYGCIAAIIAFAAAFILMLIMYKDNPDQARLKNHSKN